MMTKEKINGLTTEELVERYDIIIPSKMPDKICVRATYLLKEDQAESVIVARKQEIMQFIRNKEEAEAKARKEYSDRINAIPGLAEIEAAERDLEKWHAEWDASFNDVGGLGVRPMPKYDFKAMFEKYPRAAAYLKARKYSEKRNPELSAIGDRALKEVIYGDYKKAMENLEKENDEFVRRHAFD